MALLFQARFWILAALAIRLVYFIEQGVGSPTFTRPVLDELETLRSAEDLLAGRGFGKEPLFKAPFYTAFVAAVIKVSGEGWPWLLRYLQHVAGALLVGAAFDTARRLAPGQRWAGPLAAALLAFHGPMIRLEGRVILDVWAVLLQGGLVWALARAYDAPERALRWMVRAGVFAAFAWLNRPTLLPVLLVLAPLTVLWPPQASRRKAYLHAVLLVLPMLLAMSGFALRNQRVAGETLWMPWQGGFNFYFANRRGANGRYLVQDRFVVGESANPTHALMLDDWKAAHPGEDLRYHAVHAWWMDRGWNEFREDPAGRAWLLFQKGVYLFSAREIFNFEDYRVALETSWVLRTFASGAGVLVPLFLGGLILLPWRSPSVRILLGYTALLAGAIALFYASGRMRAPLIVPWAVLAGAGWSAWPAAKKAVRGGAVLAAGLGALLAWGDWWGVRSEELRHHDYLRLGEAWVGQGEPEKALPWLDRAAVLAPSEPRLPLLRGLAFYTLGKSEEAEAAFRAGLDSLPADPVAPFNLGMLAWQRGEWETALHWYAESARRAPRYMDAHWMGARAMTALGQQAAAFGLLRPGLMQVLEDPRFLTSALLYFRADAATEPEKSMAAQLSNAGGPEALRLAEEEWKHMGQPRFAPRNKNPPQVPEDPQRVIQTD